MAIAAVDAALWDVKARLLGVPLVTLLGAVRDSGPVASHDRGLGRRRSPGCWADALGMAAGETPLNPATARP